MRANIHSGRGTTLVFVAWIIITLAAWACRGADISAGYSFTPTDRVTSTKLNSLVGSATINPAFITGKSSAAPDVSDAFLFYSSGSSGLRQTTFANMVRDYTGLITAQTEDTTPATGDWLLTYDISAAGYKKSQLISVIFTNNALINARTNWPTPSRTTTSLLAYDSVTGEHSKLTRSNLFYQFFEFNTWTNQPTHTAPVITDTIPIFDSTAGTNKQVTFTMLMTNNPVVTTNAPSDYFVTETNGVLKKISFSSISNNIVTALIATVFPKTFASTPVALSTISAASKPVDEAHNLGGKPQLVEAVIVCTTADLGFSIGDEVRIPYPDSVSISAGANTTNVFFMCNNSAVNFRVARKSAPIGTLTAVNTASWSLKLYAHYQP